MNPIPHLARGLPLVLVAMLLGGCLDDIVESLIDIPGSDGPVWNPDGGSGFDADGLSTVETLTLLRVKPDHGPFVGGTEVVISGTGFSGKMGVTFGGKAVQNTQITLLSPLALKVVTPPGTPGAADVKVTRGSDTATLSAGFSYDALVLDPASGPTAGSTLVTIQSQGVTFAAGTSATLGGKALTDLSVLSASSVRGKTPPGATGTADLAVTTASGTVTVKEAYTYYDASNPKTGGLGGGKLAGTLTVSVLNWLNRQPVAGAKVVLQKGRDLTLTATADSTGSAVFSRAGLTGPVSLTASRKQFETTTLREFDARDVTVFLMPIPDPQPGPLPPGILAGVIRGHVLFGGATGLGTTEWKLVPEPKKGQQKRTYVYTTVPSLSWGPSYAGSGAIIDFSSGGTTAWPFTIYTRSGSMAVYAVAGIYTSATGRFEPYAMGVTRGVVVGPGEVANVDVWVTVPLTQKVTVKLKDLPAGVSRHELRLAVDLGAEGLILREDNEVKGDGVITSHTFGRLPPFNHKGLTDATYAVEAVFDTGTSNGVPLSSASEALVMPDKNGVIEVDDFIGLPRQVKPAPGGTLQGNTLVWSRTGALPTVAVTTVSTPDKVPVWRIISPGTDTVAKLPDPATLGLPAWPKGKLTWAQYLARLPGVSFDQFNYSHLSSRYWDRWSYDIFSFEVAK